MRVCLEGLQPHPNLKKLEISGFKGKRFSTWSEKMAVPQGSWVPLDNLIEIKLFGCSEIEEFPKLEHLSNLKSLSLKGLKKSIGNPSGGGRQSQAILRQLIIKECGELMELPCEMLESWAPTIEELELANWKD
ncbi:hypothetical protein SASPL_156838 [Salvia splendens]|uniref:R13L1/DRL21-like LRR repeat region domain-containing protein n=1 Tax=Salvia splendens TaxID=180675 RepID=A0A8X8VW12_SALSN|nr:hypothetical protein SASPL_156838 [Salvia splendens]